MKSIPIFCAFSFFLIAPGAYILTEHLLLVLSGEQYPGIITGFKYKPAALSHKKGTRYPIVEFMDKNSQKQAISTANMEFYFKEYSINEPVLVYYDPAREKMIINDMYSFGSQPLFLITLGGLICHFGRRLKPK